MKCVITLIAVLSVKGIVSPSKVVFPEFEELSHKEQNVVELISRSLKATRGYPIMVLLHEEANILKIHKYMKDIVRVGNKFILMKYNETDVSTVSNAETFDGDFLGLITIRRSKKSITTSNAGAVYASMLKSIEVLPPNSGILLFVDRKISDPHLAIWVTQGLYKKQIKLLVVWQGLYPTLEEEGYTLRDTSIRSGGSFILDTTSMDLYDDAYMQNKAKKSTIQYKANNYGQKVFTFPIDEGVSRILITFSESVGRAHLTSPNGYFIDLFNATSLRGFSTRSFIAKFGQVFIIHLDASKSHRQIIGSWKLDVDEETRAARGYNVTVVVENDLVLTSEDNTSKKSLNLVLQGEFSKIEDIVIRNEFGEPINKKLQYQTDDASSDEDFIETFNKRTVRINMTNVPQAPMYFEVTGKDKNGNDFVRMNYYNPEVIYNKLKPIGIEVSSSSELILTPSESASIYFEVTNNLYNPVYMNFMCRDVKSILYWMRPLRALVNPQQTINVQLSIFTKPGTYYQDLITFIAQSSYGSYEKSLMVEVSLNKRHDSTKPKLWHYFTTDCVSVLLGDCNEGYWTIEATAQDSQSGLLQLTSEPYGLQISNNFVIGTKERVVGYYSGSCCQPEIRITAIDVMHNRYSYTANAYYRTLSAGEIAGIVIGILLFIALIILIVWLCKKGKCRRKQTGRMEVATTSYRGPANSATTTRY